MKLDNATVLITGANRGLGLALACEALARGARNVKPGLTAEPAVYLLDPRATAPVSPVAAG